jgi:hypothetical protein
MAYEVVENIAGLVAGADLSTGQHKIVKLNGSGQAILATVQGEKVTGVLQDKPSAAGQAASVAKTGSVTKVVAGAAVAAGALVMTDASARAITATATNYAFGQALTASSGAGQLISVYLNPFGTL